uniref:Uncharacterized protein n=1 Tax=Arundo donax TaxID=35708 RepID=A0A0A9BDY2_ARUDO
MGRCFRPPLCSSGRAGEGECSAKLSSYIHKELS